MSINFVRKIKSKWRFRNFPFGSNHRTWFERLQRPASIGRSTALHGSAAPRCAGSACDYRAVSVRNGPRPHLQWGTACSGAGEEAGAARGRREGRRGARRGGGGARRAPSEPVGPCRRRQSVRLAPRAALYVRPQPALSHARGRSRSVQCSNAREFMAVPVVVLGAVLLAATARADVSVVWGEGARARLPCMVEGAPAPRRPPPPLEAPAPAEPARLPYIWRHHGKEVPSKKVSWDGSLEVARRPGAEGEYQCEMLALPGRLLSYPVHLRFPSMEEDVEVQPSNSTAPLGQTLALPCRVRSAPPAAISWLKDGQTLPHNSRYLFLDNDLLIIDIKNEDAGLYRCQARNERMDRTQVSDPAAVVVSSAAESPPALVALATEPNVTVEVGGSATLACPVRGWPKPKVYWELNQPSGQTSRLDSVGEVLTISRTTADDNGVYTCRIEGHPDLYKNFTLNVWERVRVVYPPASRRVQRAGTVRMDCTAEGTPQPTIRWYKDGRPISITGPIKLMRSSKTQLIELVISGATSKDAGTYQCFADNGYSVASAWAQLNVTGGGTAEPEGVGCAPVDVRTIQVRWRHKDPANIVAYTVHYSPKGGGAEMTGVPEKATAQNISIQPLSAFSFKVRAYTTASASDYSDNVECQGQGVPVDVWRTKGRVTVSWAQFVNQTVAVQWLLQVRKPTDDIVNVTLPGNTTKYELDVPAGEKWFVRLLGSKDLQWLDQDLTMVQWTSTPDADRDNNRERNAPPTIQEPVRVWPRGALITWHHGDEGTPSRHIYIVCVRIRDRLDEKCRQNANKSAKIENLQPNTQYEVRIQALTGGSSGFSQPLHFVTPPEESQRFSDVHYTPVNSSSVRVWWRAAEAALGPQVYTVRYSPHLLLPIDKWNALNVTTNDALVPLDGNQRMFVIVTAYAPTEYSLVLNITPPHIDTKSLKNIKYEHTDDGLSIVWSESEGGSATEMYSVRYSHNLTMPIEKWTEKNLTRTQLYNYHVAGVPDGAWTYVVVSPLSDTRTSHVMLNIPPSTARTHRAMLLGVSMGALVCAVCAIAGAAVCLWRRRRKGSRTARRGATSNNDGVEDGSEMKGIGRGAGSAANGGARGAGEPLLNGHVRITENPALSKTPNGKLKKQRRPNFDAFDFSRRDMEEPHTPPMVTLLDTSRPPEPYGKLPDDNMNSEMGDSPTPTLQPNG